MERIKTTTVQGKEYTFKRGCLGLLKIVKEYERDNADLFETLGEPLKVADNAPKWKEYVGLFIENPDDVLNLDNLEVWEVREVMGNFLLSAGYTQKPLTES